MERTWLASQHHENSRPFSPGPLGGGEDCPGAGPPVRLNSRPILQITGDPAVLEEPRAQAKESFEHSQKY
ncbi:hypothetical protein P7K49_028239, partial [Saguinus oedipus]